MQACRVQRYVVERFEVRGSDDSIIHVVLQTIFVVAVLFENIVDNGKHFRRSADECLNHISERLKLGSVLFPDGNQEEQQECR